MIKINDEIKRAVMADITRAEDYYSSEVEPYIEEANDIYNADKDYYKEKFPELSKRSTFTTKDVSNTVEAVMPDLMRILLGSNDIVSITPMGAEDVKNADLMEELIKHQFLVENKGYQIASRWVKSSLYKKLGVVKCTWKREYEWKHTRTTLDMNNPNDVQTYSEIEHKINSKKLLNEKITQLGNGMVIIDAKERVLTTNKPVIEHMDLSEFIFIPLSVSIDKSVFTAQRKKMTVSDLRIAQRDGLYPKERVDEAIAKGTQDTKTYSSTDDTQYKTDSATGADDTEIQTARKVLDVYECYGKYDVDNSEILEDVIVTMCNGVVLRIEKNTMGRHPFFPITPILEDNKVLGKCLTDLIEDYQHLKVAMTRQVLINTALSNKPRYFYNANAINGKYLTEDLEYIPVTTDENVNINTTVFQEQITNIAPWTLKLLEYNDVQKQETSGITSYTMGVASNANKSNTKGEAEILNQNGNKRIQLIARNLVETGFVELFKHMIDMNLKYLSRDEVIRILDKPIDTDPNVFSTKYDVIVSAGLGLGTAEQNIRAMQVVGEFYNELVPLMQLFQTNPILYKKFRKQKEKILEDMGIKDVDSYLPTVEELFGHQQPQQQAMMQQQGINQ